MTDLNDVIDARGGVYSLPLGEKQIRLAKLSLGDQADACEFLIRQRYARAEAGTGTMPITIEARAKMLADISCAPITIADVMDDPMGRLKLIELSARRAKNPVPFEALKNGLSPVEPGFVTRAILWILHLVPDTDPTGVGTTES